MATGALIGLGAGLAAGVALCNTGDRFCEPPNVYAYVYGPIGALTGAVFGKVIAEMRQP